MRQILKRYLLGTATEKEITAVDNWYNSFDNEQLVSLSDEEVVATGQEIWAKVAPVTVIERKIWNLSRPLKVAAMVILLAGVAGGSFLLYKYKTNKQTDLAFTTISTGIGEKKKITIADGSLLMLGASTTIHVQNDFSNDRKIELVDGEAFFDVKKDDERPFIIQSQGLTTTVLGTSIDISAYKELNTVSIGVVSGKVSVTGPAVAASVLEKAQELVYNKTNHSYKTLVLDDALTAWQEGRIVLNDLSFDEVAAVTQKNFGVVLTTDDNAIKNTRYTTELLSSMTPKEAVEVLAAIHDLKIQQKGNKIFLHK